ncbi:MAG TPA: Rrf2 family transcriptional regulator [Rhodocyclaceae bacterium]|nr:Rrf2 family transcriptional regulator [Rhodocyclaceae bacterium]
MKVNTKSRVAIAAILDVAVHGGDRPVSLSDISQRQRVSLSYLEQLFQKLRQKGYVASYRGPGGGYQLNRALATISVADIINAVDRETFEQGPAGEPERARETLAGATTNGLWCRINDQLRDYLGSVTLESVLAEAGIAVKPRQTAALPVSAPYVERASFRREQRVAATQ